MQSTWTPGTHASVQRRVAGEPAPTPSPRDLPHVEATRNRTPSGERRTVHCRKEPAHGHRHQERSSGRSEQGIRRQVHPAGRHPSRPASAGGSTSKARKRQHYVRPRHVSFDERNHKLSTLAVENFGRLGVEGRNFIDELDASVVGGRGGGSMARKIVKERLLQIISVTTQVTICLLYTSPSPRD